VGTEAESTIAQRPIRRKGEGGLPSGGVTEEMGVRFGTSVTS